MPTRTEKIVRWIVFGVLLALMPLAFSFSEVHAAGATPTLLLVLPNGELILISVTIAAGAAGEVMTSGREHAILKVIAGGGALLVAFFGAIYFGTIESLDAPAPASIVRMSLWLFACTVVSGLFCISLAHEKRQ